MPLVQAALDSSPKGFLGAGAGGSAVSLVGTDERAVRSLWPSPRVCSLCCLCCLRCLCCLCCPGQAAGFLGTLGRPPPSASTGLHSAPTLANVSAKTVPSTPACTPVPVSVAVQTAARASVKTLPSGRRLGRASLSFAPAVSPVRGMAERLKGASGSRGMTARPIDSW